MTGRDAAIAAVLSEGVISGLNAFALTVRYAATLEAGAYRAAFLEAAGFNDAERRLVLEELGDVVRASWVRS